MQPDLLEIKPSHIQPLWSLRTSWKAGGSIFLPDFYTFNTTARKGFTGDGLTQASIHLLCKFSEHTPELTFATHVCSNGQLGSELCSAQEKKWGVILQCEPPSSLLQWRVPGQSLQRWVRDVAHMHSLSHSEYLQLCEPHALQIGSSLEW